MAENGSKRVTILLVEDDTSVRHLARLVLERNGYSVLDASGCVEASSLSEEYPGPIDLLLTDIVMLNGCGTELAVQLSESRPNMKVLFMTGHTDEMIGRYGVRDHQVPMLRKPFGIETLRNLVEQTLQAPAEV